MKKAYIDIDGTLLTKHLEPSASLHAFIEYVTQHYDCYWLTTHMRDGDPTHLFDYLKQRGIPDETLALMKRIKPVEWDMLKTEAIDFESDYIWFDDQPTARELAILAEHGAFDSLYQVDREKGNGLTQWLQSNGVTVN